ncbi:MAG: hypothetical protein FH758_11990 [Firmicutes bacterium]|nr:hypothetical protein [Bacillota bacterium]
MNLTTATLVAQAFNLIIFLLLITAIGYVVYSVVNKIPKRIEENTKINQELIRKLDYIIEQLEEQKKAN